MQLWQIPVLLWRLLSPMMEHLIQDNAPCYQMDVATATLDCPEAAGETAALDCADHSHSMYQNTAVAEDILTFTVKAASSTNKI
jgi:hypothetical protein